MLLSLRCERVGATEHAPRDQIRVLERRHGLADFVERGVGVPVECRRVDRLQLERDSVCNGARCGPVGRRKYPDIHDDDGDLPDVEELNELGSLFESIYDSILFCIESSTERLAAALCLRRVSSAWSCALLKRMASLKGRVDQLASEKRALKGIKRTAHANYSTYYADDMYNY